MTTILMQIMEAAWWCTAVMGFVMMGVHGASQGHEPITIEDRDNG